MKKTNQVQEQIRRELFYLATNKLDPFWRLVSFASTLHHLSSNQCEDLSTCSHSFPLSCGLLFLLLLFLEISNQFVNILKVIRPF